MRMRAALFEGVGKPLAIREVDVPMPGPGQLLIRVRRCGICGSDLHLTDAHALWQVPCGTVLGHEFAGDVVRLGEGTGATWREGDRLAALPYIGCGRCAPCIAGTPFHCPTALQLPTGDLVGGFGEYAVVGAREAVRLADHVSWEEGAFVEPLAVGLHAVAAAKLEPGACVLVIGAGPIGLSAAACARMMGAGVVAVTARTDRHADRAIAMGADAFFPNDENLSAAYARLAGGPPEIVIECVGVPGMLQRSADLAAIGGRIVMAGGCNGVDQVNILTPTCKEQSFHFIICYTIREFAFAHQLIASGRIDPMPMYSGTVKLHDLPSRFEALRQDKTACKIMVDLDP